MRTGHQRVWDPPRPRGLEVYIGVDKVTVSRARRSGACPAAHKEITYEQNAEDTTRKLHDYQYAEIEGLPCA
jgi:hypothetical protein